MKLTWDVLIPWRPAFLCTDAIGWHWMRTVRALTGDGVRYIRACRCCPYSRRATNAEAAACDVRLRIPAVG